MPCYDEAISMAETLLTRQGGHGMETLPTRQDRIIKAKALLTTLGQSRKEDVLLMRGAHCDKAGVVKALPIS